MENTSGFTTVTPLALQRTCFTSEQDRLNEYAKALRVPVQTGQIIKGDQGEPGARGPQGERGPKGDKGDKGDTGSGAAFTVEEVAIAETDTEVTISGDKRDAVINLVYNNTVAPGTSISIMHIRFDGTDTIVTLSAAAPDNLYYLRVLTL